MILALDILFISPAFPPYCPVAATRPPAFARYLLDAGHQVRVLAAHNTRYNVINEAPIESELVTYVDMWLSQEIAAKMLRPLRRTRRPAAQQNANAPSQSETVEQTQSQEAKAISPFKAWLYDAFDYAFNIPDSYMGWIKNAKLAGEALVTERRPDLIFSTAPPHSANLVAHHLVKRFNLPWICEYRDLWMDHPYHTPNAVRRFFETRLERRSTSLVDHFVAVSDDARSVLVKQTGKPCALAYNGYNPADFSGEGDPAPLHAKKLTLVYAGSIYAKTRNPSLLFDALSRLGPEAAEIDVRFYTENAGTVKDLAEKFGVEGCVSFHATRPYQEILRIERQADVLYLMRWDDPREDGVIPGKIFEYIGAKRPILSTGRTQGEVADILSGRPETLLTNDVGALCAQLRAWLSQRRQGRLPDVSHASEAAYTRSAQFQVIEALFSSVVA
jgi:glycosyltransferase involved in cell wall biosynthesis